MNNRYALGAFKNYLRRFWKKITILDVLQLYCNFKFLYVSFLHFSSTIAKNSCLFLLLVSSSFLMILLFLHYCSYNVLIVVVKCVCVCVFIYIYIYIYKIAYKVKGMVTRARKVLSKNLKDLKLLLVSLHFQYIQ